MATVNKKKVVKKTKVNLVECPADAGAAGPAAIVENTNTIEIENTDGLSYLSTIKDKSISLILTDPPYIISKETGMNSHYDTVKHNEENNIEFVKTEAEWIEFEKESKIKTTANDETHDDSIQLTETHKKNYLKYGTIYGKKYCVKTDYGSWDSSFSLETLDEIIGKYYKKLKQGGTLIMFFDLWKITPLKELLEKHKFKQIRFIEWIKTNPQPLNSSVNYLTNCREIALLAVKGTKPTFNSKYDNGIYKGDDVYKGDDCNDIYHFPLQGGKHRFHPTQKSLDLFEALIKKHSNENDLVLDTFLGGGTTAIACKKTKRSFKGCEISKEYVEKVKEILATI